MLQVDKAAAGLLALGLKTGDRLGVWGPNTYEWILFQFASAKAGIILVSSRAFYLLVWCRYNLYKTVCLCVCFVVKETVHQHGDLGSNSHVSKYPGQVFLSKILNPRRSRGTVNIICVPGCSHLLSKPLLCLQVSLNPSYLLNELEITLRKVCVARQNTFSFHSSM